MSVPVRQAAPAKLNLTLKVLGRRADGYHGLESLVAFTADVVDRVTLTPSASHQISFSGPYAGGLETSATTLSTAHDLLTQAALRHLGVQRLQPSLQLGDVAVEKAIPLASGLGGGSADAAAFLRAVMACNPDWQDRLDWSAVARQVGADVPVCLTAQAQLMSGIGDQLKPVPQFPDLAVVLINTNDPHCPDKTKRVFARLNAAPVDGGAQRLPGDTTGPVFSSAGDVAAYVNEIGNDLLAPARALMPGLDAPLERIGAQPSCLAASISGAGPTVFGLFTDRAQAEAGARTIQSAAPSWWVKVSTLV